MTLVHLSQVEGEQEQALSQKELDRLALLPEYTLDNAHYYCETADVSRPFPSRHPVGRPSWEFVWNRWLTAALRECGLPGASPHLMQVRLLLRSTLRLCNVTGSCPSAVSELSIIHHPDHCISARQKVPVHPVPSSPLWSTGGGDAHHTRPMCCDRDLRRAGFCRTPQASRTA